MLLLVTFLRLPLCFCLCRAASAPEPAYQIYTRALDSLSRFFCFLVFLLFTLSPFPDAPRRGDGAALRDGATAGPRRGSTRPLLLLHAAPSLHRQGGVTAALAGCCAGAAGRCPRPRGAQWPPSPAMTCPSGSSRCLPAPLPPPKRHRLARRHAFSGAP